MNDKIQFAAAPTVSTNNSVTAVTAEGGTASAIFLGPFRRLSAADNQYISARTARMNTLGAFIYGNVTMGLIDVFVARSRGAPLLESVVPGGR